MSDTNLGEILSHCCFKYFFCSLFHFLLLVFLLCVYYTFCSCLTVLGYSVLFFFLSFFFSLYFKIIVILNSQFDNFNILAISEVCLMLTLSLQTMLGFLPFSMSSNFWLKCRRDALSTSFHGGFCSSKLWFSVSAYLSNSGGSGLLCDLKFSDSFKRSCWFSVCSAFLLVIRMEWQLTNSLYARPETRSLSVQFYFVFI